MTLSEIRHYIEALLRGERIGEFVMAIIAAYFFSILFFLISHVFHSVGLYTIAKRRNVGGRWMSWIPILQLWVLAGISDHYLKTVKGQVCRKRKLLLSMTCALIVLCIPLAFLCRDFVLSNEGISVWSQLVKKELLYPIGGICLVAGVLLLILIINQYIDYYRMYYSCSPDDAKWLMWMSLLLPFTMPFVVFALRNKEKGLPPRRAPDSE